MVNIFITAMANRKAGTPETNVSSPLATNPCAALKSSAIIVGRFRIINWLFAAGILIFSMESLATEPPHHFSHSLTQNDLGEPPHNETKTRASSDTTDTTDTTDNTTLVLNKSTSVADPVFKKDSDRLYTDRPSTHPCTGEDFKNLSWFDKTYLALSRSVCKQAKRFDRFFGDVNYESNNATSFFRVRNNFIWERNEGNDFAFAPRVRARIYLPSAQQRFNLIVTDDTEDPDTVSSSSEASARDPENENRYSTALRWIIPYSDTIETDLDLGARLSKGITTFVKVRYRKIFRVNKQSLLKASETLFWIDHIGFGERTQLDYERTLSNNQFLRWTTAATFSESTDGIDFSQRFTLYRQIDRRRAISYTVGMNGATRPYPLLENYGFGVRYRKDIYQGWLFTELEPELLWPIEEDRETTWRLTFRLEVQFGQKPQ